MDFKNILKTDYLDIVFNRRNKDYGAYELRKNYSKRMRTAAVAVVIAVSLIASIPLILNASKGKKPKKKPMVKKVELKAPPPVDKKKPPPPPPPPPPTGETSSEVYSTKN